MQIDAVDSISGVELDLLAPPEHIREPNREPFEGQRCPKTSRPLFKDSISSFNEPSCLAFSSFLSTLYHLFDETTDILQSSMGYSTSSFSPTSYSNDSTSSDGDFHILPYPFPLPNDELDFGIFLREIQRLSQEGNLLPMIATRREELKAQKEQWRAFIEDAERRDTTGFYAQINTVLRAGGQITPVSQGAGAAYFLYDNLGQPRFVIKPVDEDIGCLNNRKHFGSPFAPRDSRHQVRDDIPLYRSANTDAFCAELANLAGLANATPQTAMWILKSDTFYDLSDKLEGEAKHLFIEKTGCPDKEKLCSIQEYIPDSVDLYELTHEWMNEGLSDEEISSRFDQRDFEEVNTFIWLTGDTDAHFGNIRCYVKSIDSNGNKTYGIKKIDNGLSMAEANHGVENSLTYLPNAEKPLSKEMVEKILNLPVEQIERAIETFGLTKTQAAFKERVCFLQQLVIQEGITLYDINSKMASFTDLTTEISSL